MEDEQGVKLSVVGRVAVLAQRKIEEEDSCHPRLTDADRLASLLHLQASKWACLGRAGAVRRLRDHRPAAGSEDHVKIPIGFGLDCDDVGRDDVDVLFLS